jgi:hypothetical protein
MRLWTLHPKYLDSKGLVAVWREGLLAQKVLAGETRGYRHHPQLTRFRVHPDPLAMIASYLRPLHAESITRGYRFDASKILVLPDCKCVRETEGQLFFEWRHLLKKLGSRSPSIERQWRSVEVPEPHPLFIIVSGSKQPWERG